MVFLLRVLREQEDYLVSQGVHVIYKPLDLDNLRANVKQLLETHEHVSLVIEEEHKKNT